MAHTSFILGVKKQKENIPSTTVVKEPPLPPHLIAFDLSGPLSTPARTILTREGHCVDIQ
jgi:hypothetical protein